MWSIFESGNRGATVEDFDLAFGDFGLLNLVAVRTCNKEPGWIAKGKTLAGFTDEETRNALENRTWLTEWLGKGLMSFSRPKSLAFTA